MNRPTRILLLRCLLVALAPFEWPGLNVFALRCRLRTQLDNLKADADES